VEEKTAKVATEVQLGFAFLADLETPPLPPSRGEVPQARAARTGARPRGLADALAAARAALLDAPLGDVGEQLLPLFDFCEAALTRALVVAPTRAGVPFSAEEYRSVRGIGQAQWLLAEEQTRREARPAAGGARKTKKELRMKS